MRPAKPKPAVMWGCYMPQGHLDTTSLSNRRSDAISKVISPDLPMYANWPKLFRRGWRCRKINITAVRP